MAIEYEPFSFGSYGDKRPRLKEGTLVYLAGPMSNKLGWNLHHFNEWARRLREAGLYVINPAETLGGETRLNFHKYFEIDVGYIQAAEAIVFLPDFEESRGAKAEAVLGSSLGKPLFRMAVQKEETILFQPMQITNVALDGVVGMASSLKGVSDAEV